MDTQFGAGLNLGDTGKAHIYIRSMIDIARHENTCMSVLFIDIVAAFASLVREIIFDIEGGDEQWLRFLKDSGFSEEEIRSIYSGVCKAIDQLFTRNTAYVALASCMYQHTWASTEGLSTIVKTSSGSSAGTPLADLMYVIAISKVMQNTRLRLDSAGLVHSVCV